MHSHSMTAAATAPGIFLVGQPNVGKSVLFHRLTGTYVQVSNYPGTTVEIARAATRLLGGTEMVDTPGVLTLPVRIDDERVTLKALLEENCRVLIQVGDAKNLQRSLAATAMLAELGLPMMLVLNMLDEARARGIDLDVAELERALGIPVVATVATQGDGVNELARRLDEARACRALLRYDAQLEADISTISQRIEAATAHPRLAARGLAILFLGNDPQVQAWLAAHAPAAELAALQDLRGEMDSRHAGQLAQRLAAERAQAAQALARRALRQQAQAAPLLSQRIGRWVVHPLWGWPVLAAVLYLMYEFVGVFGATTLVGLLEEDLFEGVLNPLAKGWVEAVAPWPWLADLIVGDYGLWTMGMTYALALILPIVTTFFIAFGALEDSGYLPRLSVIANRLFAVIGLNGRAVLPMVLGLGCVTMATLTTRILASPRDRLITTFLLALAIPCSAQLGVVLGLLGGIGFAALLLWLATVAGVLVLAGVLAAQLVPGRRIPLVAELPPMRLPVAANVLKKTFGRLQWYLREVVPLFLLGTLVLFLLDRAGILPAIISAGEPLVAGWLGLPKEAAAAFVMGFLRRDFGATGLFALADALTPLQAVVGMVTITLFVPCVASLLMIVREQGPRVAAAVVALIIPFAFFVGGVLNHTLRLLGFGS